MPAVLSTLKLALVASCITPFVPLVAGAPTDSSSAGVSEWVTRPNTGLFSRQNGGIAFSGVQTGAGPAQGQVPLRKEIRQMIQNPVEFTLFLLALERFYAEPQTRDTSYYAISGIHGRPYKSWDSVFSNSVFQGQTGQSYSGYCTHGDVLFLSWHRPYLALYEQIIWEHARNIANEYPQNVRQQYLTALATLRIPYWDWASDASLPPQVAEWQTVTLNTPTGQRSIANPLYSYKFTSTSEIPDQPFRQMTETFRFPQQTRNGFASQPAAMNQAMRQIGGNLRSRTYQLLTGYRNFNILASKSAEGAGQNGQFDSLESVHDTVHGTVGSGGHMGVVDVAAFDPIFWLHHTNIDRIFAIWQGINPTGYQISGRSEMGTYAIPPGMREDLNTPLPPFRRSRTEWYTSATAGNTKSFGYAYPETIDWLPNSTPQSRVADVIRAVNQLYGNRTPVMSLQRASNISNAKRSLGQKLRRQDAKPADQLNQAPEPEALAAIEDQVVNQSTQTYNEWLTDINVNNGALNGTFNVHVFLGEISADPDQWQTSKALVGTHSVLTPIGGGMEHMVSGSVPLTSALLNKVVTGELENLKEETVVPYLKKNLKCRVSLAGGEGIPVEGLETVQGLEVQVAAAEVKLPASDAELPIWGEYKIKYEVLKSEVSVARRV